MARRNVITPLATSTYLKFALHALNWHGVLHCCPDFTGLQQLTPEIKHQSQDFADLPKVACPELADEVVQAMQKLLKQRWQELREPLSS